MKNLRKRFLSEIWTIAYRERNNENMSLLNERVSMFKLYKNTWRYWCADPFLFEHNDDVYMFFEMYDRVKRRGVIACSKNENGKFSKPKVVLDTGYHLSYPLVFVDDGKIYMIPESYIADCVQVYEAVEFPYKWKLAARVIENSCCVDSTIYKIDNIDWLFTMELNKSNYYDNNLNLYYKKDCCWNAHKQNPLTTDNCLARPAGKIFFHEGLLIRPSQDCTNEYGQGLVFNEILEISIQNYSERIIKRVYPKDIKFDKKVKVKGVHTYNHCNSYEVIDLKTYELDLVGYVSRIIDFIKRKIKGSRVK